MIFNQRLGDKTFTRLNSKGRLRTLWVKEFFDNQHPGFKAFFPEECWGQMAPGGSFCNYPL